MLYLFLFTVLNFYEFVCHGISPSLYSINFKPITSDTIKIDLRIEEPHFYVYQTIESGIPVFKDYWQGSGDYILKSVKTRLPFSGVLSIQSEDAKYICSFTNGIPNGSWRKYTPDLSRQTKSYNNLIYDVNVKNGFIDGICRQYEYDYSSKSNELSLAVMYDNGYPSGTYNDYNSYQTIDALLKLKIIDHQRAFIGYQKTVPLSPGEIFGGGDYIYNRNSVSNIDLGTPCYPKDFIDEVDMTNGYWEEIVGCDEPSIGPVLHAVQIMPEGLFQKFSYWEALDSLMLTESSNWLDGKCLNKTEYHEKVYGNLEEHYIESTTQFEYNTGYIVKRVSTLVNVRVDEYNAGYPFQGSSEIKDFFHDWDLTMFELDSFKIDSSFYTDELIFEAFGGTDFKHGENQEEWGGNIKTSKFEIWYEYGVGSYYFGRKVGVWNYFIFLNSRKVLVCSETYKNIDIPEFRGFIPGKPFFKFCWVVGSGQTWYDKLPTELLNGDQLFYNSDGTKFIGYTYKDGNVIGVIKP